MANDGDNGITVAEVLKLIVDVLMMLAQFTYCFLESIYLTIKGKEPVSVKDEIILITGSGHGIGRELSLQYAALGGNIVCVDINKENNDKTVAEIKAQGGKAQGYVCDISSREKVLELCEKVKKEVGFVSILVNNAGIMPCKVLNSQTEAEIRKMYEINVFAHLWTMQSFGKEMANKNRGHIVAMSSMAGMIGFRNLVPYCGSKFAVRGQMESFQEELRTDGIDGVKFTTICPYMVDTGLCHNPIIKFKKMMPIVKPNDCASAIIKAQRNNVIEASVPSNLRYMNTFTRLFPETCGVILKDFFSTGVGSHE